jgi:hypothetical protein
MCETFSVTLREEDELKVFEKRDEVTGGWRKLHNEELHDLYPAPSAIKMIKSRRMKFGGRAN